MRISDSEVKRIITAPGRTIVDDIEQVAMENVRQEDRRIVDTLNAKIASMPDRQGLIEEIRLQIANGTYNASGEEIVEAMLRRAIADRYGNIA